MMYASSARQAWHDREGARKLHDEHAVLRQARYGQVERNGVGLSKYTADRLTS